MFWLKLGWRNLWRNRRRSFIELVSIGGSVFIAVFFNNLTYGTYARMIDDGVRIGSGHIGIYNNRYLETRKVEQTIPVEPVRGQMLEESMVTTVHARLYVPGLIRSSRNSRAAVFLGIDFPVELSDNPILRKKYFISGGVPKEENGDSAVIGAAIANELGLNLGNKFVLTTQDANGEIMNKLYRVSGIIRTGIREIDSGMVMVPRENLARAIGREGSAHEIAVMLKNQNLIPKALPHIRDIARIQPGAKAYEWKEAMPGLAGTIRIDHAGLQIMVIFLYLIVGIGTVNTLLMSVIERSREFGLIRALGMGKGRITVMVFTEALVLSVTGAALGSALAVILGLYTSTKGINLASLMTVRGIAGTIIDPILYSGWDWKNLIILNFGMVLLTLTASLYPAWQVLKIHPSEAMRKY
ncbi:MAG: FtsX-like permease family protein [Candidatus Latescibacterota bacterium]